MEGALGLEIALLPALGRVLPVEVPSFKHVSRDPLFVGYRLIRGRPLVDEDPEGAGAFLDALHAFDACALPVERPYGSWPFVPSARSSNGSSFPFWTRTFAARLLRRKT